MDTVRTYISTLDGKQQLTLRPEATMKKAAGAPDENTLVIDPATEHQPILGFGGTLVDTDVYCLTRMSPDKRDEVLRALFDKKEGAGWNFVRMPFGSSDWERDTSYYTYDDMPRGKKDWNLEYFTIQRDIDRGLPKLLHRIKKINPDIILLASVEGVPGWMKENDSIMFGRFNPECTDVYARYLRKAVQAWNDLGIEFYAITTQNEPWTSEDRATPACRFTWRLQMPVLKALKKEFDNNGIKTQIWCYDHNFDLAEEFVKPLLQDPETYSIVQGVAMHDYGGSPGVMGRLQAMFPDMPFYMTERHHGDPRGFDRLLQQFHNGSRSYLQWATMTDEYGGPHQFQGNPFIYPDKPLPPERRGFVYNHLNASDVWGKGSSWGLYAQFTKFIRRGMIRIDSSYGHQRWVTSAAFRHPDGEIAVVLVNQTDAEQAFTLRIGEGEFASTLPAQAVGTCLINPGTLCAEGHVPVATAPGKNFIEASAFDLELAEIMLASPVKAGEEALFMARVRNVGDAPTPAGCPLFVSFSLDGDCPIGRSVTVPPIINAGGEVVVAANIPFGSKDTWTAEAGYHFICAYAVLGNTFHERNTDNNRMVKEFFFYEEVS